MFGCDILCACRVCVRLIINQTNHTNQTKQIINAALSKQQANTSKSNQFVLRQSHCLFIFNPHSPIHCMSILDNAFSYPTPFSIFSSSFFFFFFQTFQLQQQCGQSTVKQSNNKNQNNLSFLSSLCVALNGCAVPFAQAHPL